MPGSLYSNMHEGTSVQSCHASALAHQVTCMSCCLVNEFESLGRVTDYSRFRSGT